MVSKHKVTLQVDCGDRITDRQVRMRNPTPVPQKST